MSRNDWEELPDKGPQIEERRWPWKKKAKKRSFVIEHRYTGPLVWFKSDREWRVFRRYRTEKQRDEALWVLTRNQSNWEYRAYEPNTQG